MDDVENVAETSDYKPWQFKKGNPGGPGRPAGVTLKQYAREFLAKMTDDERQDYLDGLGKEVIWKMAEGNPRTDVEVEGTITNLNADLTDEQFDRLIRQRAEELTGKEGGTGTV